MEELTLSPSDTPSSRLRELAARRGVRTYEAAAWRAPAATRFDGRPANDFLTRAEAMIEAREPTVMEPMPRWLIVAIGCVVAALMGMLLGGMLAV